MEIRELVDKLNVFRNAYYNNNEMLISDKEYDDLFDQLKKLEENTGLIYPDSPTQQVGYIVQSELSKVVHNHPMLSLDKTKDIDVLYKFCGDKEIDLMLKMDGLSCTLTYDKSGNLVLAATRGDGKEGEDVTNNALCISNIPKHINNNGIPYIIDGEIIITYSEFNKVNSINQQNYSHPRNLASGSIRQLDTRITKERNLTFVAWKVVGGDKSNSFSKRLLNAEKLGFTIVPSIFKKKIKSTGELKTYIDILVNRAKEVDYPIDGMVVTFDDISYGENLGLTSHHPRHSLAFKLYDESQETILRNIEWNTTRTGIIAPIAIFDPVDLGGALTSRATLHNISIMKYLELGIGDTITVYRANQVIPKINDNLTRSNNFIIPDKCPCCGAATEIKKDGIAEVLYCTNEKCSSRLLAQFEHFCSKGGMNINGLSEAILEKFINLGLISSFKDIYKLKYHRDTIEHIDGFGTKSCDKLFESINKSRNVKLENFLVALGIKNIGKSASITISNEVNGNFELLLDKLNNNFDFSSIKDFGSVANKSLYDWYKNADLSIADELNFIVDKSKAENNDFISGKSFVVTGAFNTMKRSELEKLIVDAGGKLTGSVSKKTDYLLTNEQAGTNKYNKAKELNIPILSEEEFLNKLN